MKQLAGLSDHFENETLDVKRQLTNVTRVLYLNVDGDLMDLEKAINRERDSMSLNLALACSALIKVVGDNRDIYFAHDTWFHYRSMLRIQKKYTFPWHHGKNSRKFRKRIWSVARISVKYSSFFFQMYITITTTARTT